MPDHHRWQFTETMQLGIVVRDLDASIACYQAYGIGPWSEILTFGPDDADDYREGGEPGGAIWRVASTTVGDVMWELLQPLNDEGIYARHLADHGEGIQHVAVRVTDFDATVAAHAAAGKVPPLEGTFMGIRIAYLDTVPELGVMIETGDLSEQSGDHAATEPSGNSSGSDANPPFTQTLQLGIVVRDLDASVARYEGYGIGPWSEPYVMDGKEYEHFLVRGEPFRGASRVRTANVGAVQWEVFEPIGDEGIFAEWLAEHGEGVHHVCVGVRDYDETMATHGQHPLLDAEVGGVRVSYLDSHADLGVILEVADLPADFRP